MRVRETALRRAEQEVDSIGFRNKQLEHRVATLQDDLDRIATTSNSKRPASSAAQQTMSSMMKSNSGTVATDTSAILSEELQKKIIANAELASLVADRNAECQLFADRIAVLETKLSSKLAEHTDSEKQMRRELDALTAKNAMLETRLAVDAASSVLGGSDDTISLSADSDLLGTPRNHAATAAALTTVGGNNNSAAADAERMAKMEKELLQLRMKCDFIKCCDIDTMLTVMDGRVGDAKEIAPDAVLLQNGAASVSPTSVVASLTNTDALDGGSGGDDSRSTILFSYFSDKLEKLYTDKVMAESKVITYVKEVTCIML